MDEGHLPYLEMNIYVSVDLEKGDFVLEYQHKTTIILEIIYQFFFV